ncbi:MAG TPA: arsenic resistance N-acetyltransferase ArsN2 [Chitinophagaceae bacterium]|nr:arsenic resistance N-acetyltransferase ArsN2 [Chitinophagaceae bacterium]
MNYKLVPAKTEPIRQDVIRLLEQNELPVSDLTGEKELFALTDESGSLAGTGGLEIVNEAALVRSVSVKKELQGKGLGNLINRKLEELAKSKGIQQLYLLTTTAKSFFEKEGYSVISRDDVPDAIKETSEFSSVCPSTATVMKKDLGAKKKLLFVCIENSNRSQMSQAFAKMIGGEHIEAYSAGSKPSGIVNPKAIAAMKELGYDLSKHESKSLEDVKQYAPFDAVVTMGCGDACPWMPAKKFVDWEIPDPKHMGPEAFNKVRDLIAEKVRELVRTLSN